MILAWQGWRIEAPERWAPVKIDGDWQAGSMLIADLHRPRLGVRWKREKGKRFDAAKAIRQAMVREVGELAAKEANKCDWCDENWVEALFYEEKEPPGRDVWIGYSKASGRVFELVYHVRRRERLFEQSILPTLKDVGEESEKDWSVFDLSCRTVPGVKLETHRLNAGDLGLMFKGPEKNQAVTLRQIAVATLALQRRPLAGWIKEQASWRGRYYAAVGEPAPADEQQLFRQQIGRRWRFWFMWWLPKTYSVLARHDEARDRLVVVDATSEALAEEMMRSVGWSQAAGRAQDDGSDEE